jgi:aminoglycoside phosphotransferase (APT) family kinase protein
VATARCERAAAVLGGLHRLPPDAIGLADEPVVGAVDEIERWSRTLQSVDPNLVAGWEDVRAMLEQSAPPSNARTLVHGDYRLGNLLADEDRITAVIDWEIWSVSDPRIDLGWFLVNCDPRTYDRGSRYAGDVPPREELGARYLGAGGPDVDAVPWFQALACFKSTATWSLIVKHNRRRATPDPAWEAMAPVLPGLLRRAPEFLSA